jgi:beta-aspartyl-peptidase (threonine type)
MCCIIFDCIKLKSHMKKIAIAIHGGAGTILKSKMTEAAEKGYRKVLDQAVSEAHLLLSEGASALDAVELAVKIMEDSPLYNAGKGSVFTAQGTHEMDASIMDGSQLNAGAVCMISGIKNPVSLARLVMEKSGHVFLAGDGAMEFAKSVNCEIMDNDYFYTEYRYNQLQELLGTNITQLDHSGLKDEKFGTVGAVALDEFGNIAAATSTGGMTNKKFGRVGDSPMIGAGNYANNKTCAVSCTGSGEFFIRKVVAYDVSCLMEFKGLSLQEATTEVVHKRLLEIGGDGGLVAIDAQGNISMEFNTDGMYRASVDANNHKTVAIYK